MARRARFNAEAALKRIIDDESDDSVDEHSDAEDDFVPHSQDMSESEEEDDQVENPETDIESQSSDGESDANDSDHEAAEQDLLGKNGKIWQRDQPINQVRRQVQDIVREARGTRNCNGITSAANVFELFLTNDIVMTVVRYTNRFARSVYQTWNEQNPNDIKIWQNTDDIECKAFIGLLLLAGVYRCNHESLDELWNEEEGRAIFRATMTLKRFKQLLRFCRFDDKSTRDQRKRVDKLAAFRDIWEMFLATFRQHYKPSAFLTIDEQLVPFRGRCPFRQYMQSKPAKYGIKIWWMCDAETSFPLNGQVYLGKAEDGKREVNQGARVVKDLIRPLYNSGRNVTMDNFFTSIPLAEELLAQKITVVGTLRGNKPELPAVMKPSNAREVESSLFGFSGDLTLVSYVPKKNKAVNLLSTMHHDKSIPQNDNPRHKPEIVLFYNETKGGVDNLDKLVGTYSSRRKTLRWPMNLFFNMLDVAGVAAIIVWLTLYPDWMSGSKCRRRKFLRELGKQLTLPLIERRIQNPRAIQKGVRSALKLLGYDIAQAFPRTTDETRAKRRCRVCPRNVDRKTRSVCAMCERPVCKQHARQDITITCEDCEMEQAE